MAKAIQLKNGVVIPIPEGMSAKDTYHQFVKMTYKNFGVKEGINPGAAGEEAARQAGHRYSEVNPAYGRAAAYQASAKNMGRGLLQMALPEQGGAVDRGLSSIGLPPPTEQSMGVSDEDINRTQALEAPVVQDNPKSALAGEIIPSMILPAGTWGTGIQGVKAGLGSTAKYFAKTLGGRAAAEGAVFNAATARPQDRGKAAVAGAAGGYIANRGARLLSRTMGRGLAPITPQARAVQTSAKAIPGGEAPFIPLSKAVAAQGEGSIIRTAYDRILRHFPGPSTQMGRQLNEASDTQIRNMIKSAYPPDVAEAAIAQWRATNSFNEGLKVAEQMVGRKGTREAVGMRKVLHKAALSSGKAVPNMQNVVTATEQLNKGRAKHLQSLTPPFREMATQTDEVLGRALPEQGNLGVRNMVFEVMNMAGALVPSLISKPLANQKFQTFLMGNTQVQQQLYKMMQEGNKAGVQQMLGRIAREIGLGGDESLGEINE